MGYELTVPQANPTQADCVKGLSQSMHPGVVLIALADGSVRTVATSITPTTWARALQPADGEKMGEDW